MAYDVPGRREARLEVRGPLAVDGAVRRAASSAARSHHHGGATHQTLSSVTCGRPLLDAKAYYGAPTTSTTRSARSCTSRADRQRHVQTAQGIPIAAGEMLERAAFHANAKLHVAAMGFWVLQLVRDDSVTACAPMPTDLHEVTKPARYDEAAPFVYDRVVPAAGQADRSVEGLQRAARCRSATAGSSRSA